MVDRINLFGGHAIYLLVLLAVALAVPANLWNPESKEFLFLIGVLGIWRYSWAVIHWVRFLIYNKIVFPKWRQQAEELGPAGRPPHVYLLVTSFRIGTETTQRVYDSIFAEAIAYDNETTIIASIVERCDETLIKHLFLRRNPPDHIKLCFVRIAGTGKRDALACGFRAISKMNPHENSVAAVIDGDSMLAPGMLEKCCPMFKIFPRVGALTTEEICEVEGSDTFRQWYNVRFAQRHILMSSVGLSKHVLTLTGRMSMFRARLLTKPEFIDRVELDWIDHWRFGRFKFLTGDDKSSWFDLLRENWQMLYIPDAVVVTIETPPDPNFLNSSFQLMRRWFGNMLRTNTRAIKLGPRGMGIFTWWCVIDQRVSMWTSLTGPTVAVLGSIIYSPVVMIYYFLWIGISRYILALSLLTARPTISPTYPFFLFFNQLFGSLVKTYVLFHLEKQRWTRQNTVDQTRQTAGEALIAFSSTYMQILAYGYFICALAVLSGAFVPLDSGSLALFFDTLMD